MKDKRTFRPLDIFLLIITGGLWIFVVAFRLIKNRIKSNKSNGAFATIESYSKASHITERYNKIRNSDSNNNVSYSKHSKLVSIFTKKWFEVCCKDYVVLDFETTGLDKVYDKIIEVAAIRFVNGVEHSKYVSLVNPQCPIPAEASTLNHITNAMVVFAPTEKKVIPELLEFIGNSLVVGHNVNFDVAFLEIAAQRQGLEFKCNYIDTMSISKKLFADLPDYKLETIAHSLGINTRNLHRAEKDVYVCAEIMKIAIDTGSESFSESPSTPKPIKTTSSPERENIINPHFKEIREDLFILSTSSCCPYCSIYGNRVYSISGADRRFPSFSKLPVDLRNIKCPVCDCYLGVGNYFPLDINGELKDMIKRSCRPFTDMRTFEQKMHYEKEMKEKHQKQTNRLEYEWLYEHLPEMCPKSLGGYVRMKNSNSVGFRQIVSEASKQGYLIQK